MNANSEQATVMILIDTLIERGFPSVPSEGAETLAKEPMPSWMHHLLLKIQHADTHVNVKYFIGKIVSNRPRVFKRYAADWIRYDDTDAGIYTSHYFSPLILLILTFDVPGSAGINYFIVDISVVLLSWADVAIPTRENSPFVGRLFMFLIANARHESGPVFRNNINIIKTFAEKWRFDHKRTVLNAAYNVVERC